MRTKTANYFLCKIRYEKTMEDGLQKKVTEQYVVDAVSFTEAEARIIEQMASYISGEFEVAEIDRCVFKEIFFMGFAAKVLHNDEEKLAKAISQKDKESFKKWENETLEQKMENTDSRWYKSKLQFITIDERTNKEKRTSIYYLVEGCSLESARRNIDEVMGNTMIDYIISSVSETSIMDVLLHHLIRQRDQHHGCI